jgi:hypothetical protein
MVSDWVKPMRLAAVAEVAVTSTLRPDATARSTSTRLKADLPVPGGHARSNMYASAC